jgi:hypothetical protein
VVEEIWDAQQAFGTRDTEFLPFWQQRDVVCSDDELRVSLWKKKSSSGCSPPTSCSSDRRRVCGMMVVW